MMLFIIPELCNLSLLLYLRVTVIIFTASVIDLVMVMLNKRGEELFTFSEADYFHLPSFHICNLF